MSKFSLFILVFLAPLANAASYECKSMDSRGVERVIQVTYNPDTLLITADGPSWALSAYVSRQESKTTGDVLLTVPQTYSMSAFTVRIHPKTKVLSFDHMGDSFSCADKN